MVRNLGALLMLVGFLVLLAIWSPWQQININLGELFGFTQGQQNPGIQVRSLAGTLSISINGEEVGTVSPETSPFIYSDIQTGDNKVTLNRISESGVYATFDKVISFESGKDVVLSYELGPTSDFSQGQVIFYEYSSESESIDVEFRPIGNAAGRISVDNQTLGNSTATLDVNKQYQVKISLDGYETQTFTLLPDNQTSRDRLKGSKVIVEYDLFLLPVRIINE